MNNKPWVEKYRPKNINDIKEQYGIINTLQNSLKTHQLPHCLFYGPPGTGKTTTALAICRQLYGKKYFNERVLELNASDERGIQVVREKIKKFAKKKNVSNDKQIPNYKIIILDEADALTNESQFALRRIIEENSLTTRFFLICNYISKIIQPLLSRCALYKFKNLSNKVIKDVVIDLCQKENIKINLDLIEKIIDYCNGDLRKVIHTIQRLNFLKMDDNIIDDITITLTNDNFNNLIKHLKNACNYNKIYKITQIYIKNAFDCNNLLNEISKKIIYNTTLNEVQKSLLFLKLSELDYLLNNGNDEEIILINLFTYFNVILNKYDNI